MSDKKYKTFQIRLDVEAKIKELKERLHLSESWLINEAIERLYEQYDIKKTT